MTSIITTITPEIIAVALGFALRHLLMPYFSGKETSNLLKYLRTHEITKDEQAELKYNLAEARLWMEIHAKKCPYVKTEIEQGKKELLNIINKGHK